MNSNDLLNRVSNILRLPSYTPSQKAMHQKVRNIIPQAKQTFQGFKQVPPAIDRSNQKPWIRTVGRIGESGLAGPVPQLASQIVRRKPETALPIAHYSAGLAGPIPVEQMALGQRLPEQDKYRGYRVAGGATSGAILGGPRLVVGAAGFGGVLGAGGQTISNILQRQPATKNIIPATISGASYGVETSPTFALVGSLVETMALRLPFLKPLTDTGIKGTLPMAQMTIKEALVKIGETGFKRIIKAAIIETPIEGVVYGVKNRQDKEKLAESIKRELWENFKFNIAFAGANTAWDSRVIVPILKKSFEQTLSNYPQFQSQNINLGLNVKPVEPKERLRHLMTYQEKLSELGYEKDQLAFIGHKEATNILKEQITPEAHPSYQKVLQTRGDKKYPESGFTRPSYKTTPDWLKEGPGGAFKPKEPSIKRTALSRDVVVMKDISTTQKGMQDVYRNFKQVYGDRYPEVKSDILDPFDKSKGDFIAMQRAWTSELKIKIVDGYGFKKGSKESAAIQQFGEGIKSYDDLIKEFGKTKADNIMSANKWFRSAYDNLLDTVNKTRKQIYPNNPDMIIPKRKDYYRHFKELTGVEGLKNIFEAQAGVDPFLTGISEFTKPKSKWLSFAQRRMMKTETDYDAIGGFLEYLPKAAYSTHIDPHINKFRDLSKELAVATTEGGDVGAYKKLNNFIEYLEDFSNDLAGKTNPLDRGVQKYIPGGRKTFQVINWLNRRIKANVVVGNLASSFAQIFNVPQGIASAGEKHFLRGTWETVISAFQPTKVLNESDFLNERFSRKIYSQFNTGIFNKPKDFAVWLLTVGDEGGTKMIWNAHYHKAISEGMQNPIKYADDITREMVAGRGVGEVPMLQKSKLFQLFAPFQVEVGNAWNIMKGWYSEKEFMKLAKLFVWNYLFNSVSEKIIGRRVIFDPIDAIADAIGTYREEEDKTIGSIKATGRVIGEPLSNYPGLQSVAAMYPEYGIKIPGTEETLTRKEFFGEGDPTKYGTGLLLTKGIQDPLYKLIPPWGGSQLKKTIGGAKMVDRGYSESASGRLRFLAPDSPLNKAQALAFGEWSTPEAQAYRETGFTPLGEKQTELVKKAKDRVAEYQKIMAAREASKQESKVKDMIRGSGVGSHYNDKYFYLDTNSGDVRTIDFGFEPEVPEQTGNYELDKKLRSKFYGQITKKANYVVSAYEQKLLTEKEAEEQLKELAELKASVKGGPGRKAKKITIKGIPFKKSTIRFKKTKPGRITGLSIPKTPIIKKPRVARII